MSRCFLLLRIATPGRGNIRIDSALAASPVTDLRTVHGVRKLTEPFTKEI